MNFKKYCFFKNKELIKKIFFLLLGKAFAITTTMEKIGPLVSTPLFVFLHTNYIQNYPCPVWFLNAGLSFIIIIFAIIVRRRWNKLKVDNFKNNNIRNDL